MLLSFKDFLKESKLAQQKLAQLRAKKNAPPKTPPISKSQLDVLEKHLDNVFRSLKIDITFTRHFFERLGNARNKRTITIGELNALFQKTHDKFGVSLTNKKDNFQAVLNDLNTNINVPFVLNVNKKGQFELVTKTVLRTPDFKTSNLKLKV